MIRALIFDLDDTLFLEADYYRGGFRAVSAELAARGVGDATHTLALFERWNAEPGFDRIFQRAASELGFDEAWVADLVRVYREAPRQIELCVDAAEWLPRWRREYRLGCVTNGRSELQRAKLRLLGLDQWLETVAVSGELPPGHAKPNPAGLLKVAATLAVPPSQCVYVGDQPAVDGMAARGAGMRSVRMRRPGGFFAAVDATDEMRADIEVPEFGPMAGWLETLRIAGSKLSDKSVELRGEDA
jgi:putative hydrolase of the HAD superfamily